MGQNSLENVFMSLKFHKEIIVRIPSGAFWGGGGLRYRRTYAHRHHSDQISRSAPETRRY